MTLCNREDELPPRLPTQAPLNEDGDQPMSPSRCLLSAVILLRQHNQLGTFRSADLPAGLEDNSNDKDALKRKKKIQK